MSYRVEIVPSGVGFNSEQGQSLLDAALSGGIHLEHSCRNGNCGLCEAEVISGSVKKENGESVSKGKVLTCCSHAESNVSINATYFPELADIKQIITPCKVDEITFPVTDVIMLRLRLPPTAKFNYLPGQYIDLAYKGITRSYSVANAQTVSKVVELHIRRVIGGQFCELLFNEIKANQLLTLEGPKGTFFVRDSDFPIVFLAGGTGFAPVKAMVEELLARDSQREIHIYWGMPISESLYTDIAEQWAAAHFNVHYVPVISGEDDSWKGKRGFVHHAVMDDFENLECYEVYACGSEAMIRAAKEELSANGLRVESFFSDIFTSSNKILSTMES